MAMTGWKPEHGTGDSHVVSPADDGPALGNVPKLSFSLKLHQP